VTDWQASAAYPRRLVKVLVCRALTEALRNRGCDAR
jgi:CO/xanthine dehydrogenase FAD-binding subunit